MASIIQTQSSLQATCGTRTPAEREQATACDQPVSEVSSDDGNLAAQTFGSIEMGVVDPDEVMLRRIRADTSTGKTDLMPGVFTSEQGGYFEFEAIRKAKDILAQQNPGHGYISIFGISELREGAQKLLFGDNHQRVLDGQVVSMQTIGGCGANRIGAAFLRHHFPSSFPYEKPSGNSSKVYIGNPGWRNHGPLFQHAGFDVVFYNHYDSATHSLDFKSMLNALTCAPQHSIFVLQVCCHNPTGADLTHEQWKTVAAIMKDKGHFPFLDFAYGGYGSTNADGGYTDAWPIRHLADLGMDFIVAQTFSKCMSLYGERVGCLHFVCSNSNIAEKVLDQARCLVRWEYSSPPAFAARLVGIILSNTDLQNSWMQELANNSQRVVSARKQLHQLLADQLHTPGDWSSLLRSSGMFAFLPLSPEHTEYMAQKFHLWMPNNGRMNLAALVVDRVEIVGRAIDAAIRELGPVASAQSI